MRNCFGMLRRCLNVRYAKLTLFCGFVLYCHTMFHAYQLLERLSIGVANVESFEKSNTYLTLQGVQNITASDDEISEPHVFNIWPLDDSDNDERIVEQLHFARAHKNIFRDSSLKFIYTGGIVNMKRSGRDAFTIDDCPIDTCYLMNAHTKAEDKSIYYDALLTSSYSMPKIKMKPNGVVIWFQLESPLYTTSPARGVNWTATYRRSSTMRAPYELFLSNKATSSKNKKRNYAKGKLKMAAAFISNCQTKNNRSAMVEELQKHISVDVYGRCGYYKCPRRNSKACFSYLSTYYKFYLSFENSNCRDYITEKFFLNGLSNDVVPVVMGAHPDDYRAVAPPHSYIHVDDFESPRHLADYLKLLDKNDTLYNEYFKWKGTGSFINTKFWCRLCAMLHARDQTNYVHTYNTLTDWWRTDQCVMPKGPFGATWRNVSSTKP